MRSAMASITRSHFEQLEVLLVVGGLDQSASSATPSGEGLSFFRLAMARVTMAFFALFGRQVKQHHGHLPLTRWAAICAPITPAPSTATFFHVESGHVSLFGDLSWLFHALPPGCGRMGRGSPICSFCAAVQRRQAGAVVLPFSGSRMLPPSPHVFASAFCAPRMISRPSLGWPFAVIGTQIADGLGGGHELSFHHAAEHAGFHGCDLAQGFGRRPRCATGPRASGPGRGR